MFTEAKNYGQLAHLALQRDLFSRECAGGSNKLLNAYPLRRILSRYSSSQTA